jgi:hypothetical protein
MEECLSGQKMAVRLACMPICSRKQRFEDVILTKTETEGDGTPSNVGVLPAVEGM